MADSTDRGDAERDEVARAPRESQGLPAGLEDTGRDEGLEHPPEISPSGGRGDHRHSAPGTAIPGAPRPAAEGDPPD